MELLPPVIQREVTATQVEYLSDQHPPPLRINRGGHAAATVSGAGTFLLITTQTEMPEETNQHNFTTYPSHMREA